MSEIMRPMPFARLMNWALGEYSRRGSVFGVRKDKFYVNSSGGSISIFGQRLGSPIGPAAGPNSQLAQNIVASYLAGCRFMELKTVQKMDGEELRKCVPRPCINAEDEGYNVEWSTELTVPEAFGEYVKAWIAIHVLGRATLVAGDRDFVFNMSVGYDIDGIKSPKIDSYIEGMKDASATDVWRECTAWLRDNVKNIPNVGMADIDAISPRVSDSVTLSTLHGCPPEQIELMAKYLLEEKKVHAFIKCNPTLLGYKKARALLDGMGYGYIDFDDHHFQNDLQYADAVGMLQRLKEYAAARARAFGVKITNTFPVKIARGELPGEEMYMSGRALFPLSINVAARLAEDFDGALPISYSGGADAFNIVDIFKTGIQPITVATTILKPGGYGRCRQLASLLEPHMSPEWKGIDKRALSALADSLQTRKNYRKEHRPAASRKTAEPLPLFDCYQAPCKSGGCPIEQQIPEYLHHVARGDHAAAFRIIAVDNAVPSVTGTLCNHACQGKCTRMDYDSPLHIRNAKLIASDTAQKAFTDALKPPAIKTEKKAVIVGAGPAGVSAALFLRRNGVAVTVLEKRDRPFGIVEYVIPEFRIASGTIRRDFEMAEKMGVDFRFGVPEVSDIAALRKEYDFVLLAVGAWKESAPAVNEGEARMLDALAFLENSKRSRCRVDLGRKVAVIGGGDVAMDCARAAVRAPGVEEVTIVYRRTREFMPAEAEEIRLALDEGVGLVELLAPVRYDPGVLRCERMTLSDRDASGRRGVVGLGAYDDLRFDTVICATGARVDGSAFAAAGLKLDGRKRPELNSANESSVAGVYVIGDCRAGPSTIVAAVADAKRAARDILKKLSLADDFVKIDAPQNIETLYGRKGVLRAELAGSLDAERCLVCDQLCEMCCDVCPNRANVRVAVDGFRDSGQIVHIDALCNECGNCGVFCPHKGNPYLDKLTVFESEEDFRDSKNRGFLKTGVNAYLFRLEDGSELSCGLGDPRVPERFAAVVRAVEKEFAGILF